MLQLKLFSVDVFWHHMKEFNNSEVVWFSYKETYDKHVFVQTQSGNEGLLCMFCLLMSSPLIRTKRDRSDCNCVTKAQKLHSGAALNMSSSVELKKMEHICQ